MDETIRKAIYDKYIEPTKRTRPDYIGIEIIYDGDLMYVHKNLKNTLCFKRLENGIVFSTKPLDDGIWVPFPMAQVIAYREGQEVYRGERHKGIFVPPLDYITVNDAMYI